MAGDSQASFSQSVRNRIRETYKHRCVICLAWIDTTQCAHVLDAATPGALQLRNAVTLGVLPKGYQKNALANGMVQCPNCHALFTKNRVVLSLPIPVLKYLEKYVRSTRKAVLKPLHEVFDLLVEALNGESVELPDPAAIIPYIGLFTLVTLDPATTARNDMTTPYLPGLSIIDNHKFDVAPANMSATATNVARIFKPLEVKEDTPFNIGILSISPGAEAFKEKRYWQLPVSAAAIFAALVARLQNDLSGCEDIVLAKKIVAHLTLKRYSGPSSSGGPRGDSGGPSGGGGGGEGPSGGERRRSKRKNASGESSAPAKEGNRKARNVAGGDEAGDCGECSGASSEALRSFLVPLGPSWNVEFPPGVRSQYGQSNRREIAFGDDKPAKLIDADKDNSDSETGRSISAINPPDEDNPDEWRFGPSFSTNKIVFTARAVKLT